MTMSPVSYLESVALLLCTACPSSSSVQRLFFLISLILRPRASLTCVMAVLPLRYDFWFPRRMWKPARRYARFVLLMEIMSSLYHCAGAWPFRVTVSRYLVRILYQRPRRYGKKPKDDAGGMFRKKKTGFARGDKKGTAFAVPCVYIYCTGEASEGLRVRPVAFVEDVYPWTRSTVFMPSRETRPTFATVSSIEAPKTPCGTVRCCPSSAHSIAQ